MYSKQVHTYLFHATCNIWHYQIKTSLSLKQTLFPFLFNCRSPRNLVHFLPLCSLSANSIFKKRCCRCCQGGWLYLSLLIVSPLMLQFRECSNNGKSSSTILVQWGRLQVAAQWRCWKNVSSTCDAATASAVVTGILTCQIAVIQSQSRGCNAARISRPT